MLFSYTNRRRAKDAAMLICDQYSNDTDNVTVFIMSGVIYIDTDGCNWADIKTIFHYGSFVPNRNLSDVFEISQATEVYRGEGLRHFRV